MQYIPWNIRTCAQVCCASLCDGYIIRFDFIRFITPICLSSSAHIEWDMLYFMWNATDSNNLLYLSDGKCHPRSCATVILVMACRLTKSSHHWNKCWPIVGKILINTLQCVCSANVLVISQIKVLKNMLWKMKITFRGIQPACTRIQHQCWII